MIIEVNKVSKSYGKQSVLKEVSFSIAQPSIVALVGPNGSGKSTLLNAMVNQLDIDSGEIRLCDKPHTDIRVFHQVAFLRDNTVLYPYMTGMDHLAYGAGIYGLKRQRIEEVIDLTEIRSFIHKKIHSYSLGMKQQLLIALVLLNDPEVLILDEPLNGLDPSRILYVRQLFHQLHQAGKTILMSSHTLSEVDAVTNHILFLKDGLIQEERLIGGAAGRAEERYVELFSK